jgi:hypothetical protein
MTPLPSKKIVGGKMKRSIFQVRPNIYGQITFRETVHFSNLSIDRRIAANGQYFPAVQKSNIKFKRYMKKCMVCRNKRATGPRKLVPSSKRNVFQALRNVFQVLRNCSRSPETCF